MRKPPAWHLLKILIVAVKQVGGIDTDADGALDGRQIKGRGERNSQKFRITWEKKWMRTKVNCTELNR